MNKGTFIGEIIKDIKINENKNNKKINPNPNNIKKKKNNDEKNNEIICIYNKKDKEPINLLFNFNNAPYLDNEMKTSSNFIMKLKAI